MMIDNLPLSIKDQKLYEKWKTDRWSITYKEYLASDHWQIIKKEKLESVNWRCQLCNKKICYQRYSLWPNTHHRSYYCLWKESFEDVFLVCRECHAIHHNKIILKDLQYPEAIGRLVARRIEERPEEEKKRILECLVESQRGDEDNLGSKICGELACFYIYSALYSPLFPKEKKKTFLSGDRIRPLSGALE